MKTYVTFGQVHVHEVNGKVFDKDCVACIEAPTKAQGRRIAMDVFQGIFATTYFDDPPDMRYFPRGVINLEDQ